MQDSFAFATTDLAHWRALLTAEFGAYLPTKRRSPLGQLVKSIISSKTRDEASQAAFRRLRASFRSPAALAAADAPALAVAIAGVTHAEAKAGWLVEALAMIGAERSDHDLAFLADMPLPQALAWLERLPGVARKVSASTLNASTLNRPVFIVDTHVLRGLARLGFVRPAADIRTASEAVTAAMRGWSGDDFLAFHIRMKTLGQTICRWDVPECPRCPLNRDCPTAKKTAPALAAAGRLPISPP